MKTNSLLVVTAVIAATFLVQKSVLADSASRPANAPENAFEHSGNWYALIESEFPVTWDIALWESWRMGGHLVCLESKEEDKFVREKLKDFPGSCWAGGTMRHAVKDAPHRLWWLSGAPMEFQNIGSLPPPKCAYYMALLSAKEDHKWGFYQINAPGNVYAFLCEWPADAEVAKDITPGYPSIRIEAAYKEGKRGARLVKEDDDEDDIDSRIERIVRTDWSAEIFKDYVVKGTSGSVPIPIKLEQCGLRGLVVRSVTQTKWAGKSSKLTATVFPVTGDEPAEVSYNQVVGPQMRKALTELVKFVQFRLKGWPRGKRIEISFEDKYVAKDGPSAAVACALLLDSILTGDRLDELVAVTGDLNVDGSVQPVGGIEAKIRGAAKTNCTLVVLPEKNVQHVRDSLIEDGIESLLQIPVFSAEKYDQARELALADRSDAITTALARFQTVAAVLKSDSSSLQTPEAARALDELLALCPNFVSAALLKELASKDFAAQKMSLPGSLAAIDQAIEPLRTAAFDFREDEINEKKGSAKREPPIKMAKLAEVKTAVVALQPKLAVRTNDYLAAVSKAIAALESGGDWPAAFKEMKEIYADLWDDPEVVEAYFIR